MTTFTKRLILLFLFGLVFFQIPAISSEAIKTQVISELHSLTNAAEIITRLPKGSENKLPLSIPLKELLTSSFPALVIKDEAIIDEAATNSFSVVNLLTGRKKMLHQFPSDLLTGVAGGLDETYAWVSTYKRKYDGKFQIWRINKSTGEIKFIIEATSLYFSSKCGKIAYVGNKNQIFIREADGTESIIAANSDAPIISTDCQGILALKSAHGLHELIFYSKNSDGKFKSKTVARSILKEFSPKLSLSKNSQYVAFQFKNDLVSEPVQVIRISDGQEIYSSTFKSIKVWFFSEEGFVAPTK